MGNQYALGDIIRTQAPIPIIVFSNTSSYTPAAGDPVAINGSGLAILAVNTSDGPLFAATNLTHAVSGTTYYGFLIFGIIIMQAGGTIQANKFVAVNSSSLVIAATTTVNTAFVQGDIQALWRVLGLYLWKDGDNQYNPSAAANTNNIAVFVGRTP